MQSLIFTARCFYRHASSNEKEKQICTSKKRRESNKVKKTLFVLSYMNEAKKIVI